MKLLFIGGLVLTGGLMLSATKSKEKMIQEILNSSKLDTAEKEHFKNNVFTTASKEEVSYIYQLIIRGQGPKNINQKILHIEISEKYNIFT